MVCADGYKPRIVENETAIDLFDGYPYQYFTCCPSNLSSDADVSRRCSNSTLINDLCDPMNKTIDCDDTIIQYPRQMKNNSLSIDSYIICCDSIIKQNDNGINYLDEIECVPYYDKLYQTSRFPANLYGIT
jgi:hypothetical protein